MVDTAITATNSAVTSGFLSGISFTSTDMTAFVPDLMALVVIFSFFSRVKGWLSGIIRSH